MEEYCLLCLFVWLFRLLRLLLDTTQDHLPCSDCSFHITHQFFLKMPTGSLPYEPDLQRHFPGKRNSLFSDESRSLSSWQKPTSTHSFLVNEISCSHNTWTWVLKETISKTLYWKQTECPSVGKLWNEVWHICATNSRDKSYLLNQRSDQYPTIWTDLKGIMLSAQKPSSRR